MRSGPSWPTSKARTKQHALAKIAVLPVIMCVCYLVLIVYFQFRGGYQAQVLTGHAAQDEKFTGGTAGPGRGIIRLAPTLATRHTCAFRRRAHRPVTLP